jgi:hypothetical protein
MNTVEKEKEQEILKDILSITMQLKAKFPGQYAHLDETPVFKQSGTDNELIELEDYRNTLAAHLKQGDKQQQQTQP